MYLHANDNFSDSFFYSNSFNKPWIFKGSKANKDMDFIDENFNENYIKNKKHLSYNSLKNKE